MSTLRSIIRPLGVDDWSRKLKGEFGSQSVITAAHKFAGILLAIVKHRRPCEPKHSVNPVLIRARMERHLRRQAESSTFALPPTDSGARQKLL